MSKTLVAICIWNEWSFWKLEKTFRIKNWKHQISIDRIGNSRYIPSMYIIFIYIDVLYMTGEEIRSQHENDIV